MIDKNNLICNYDLLKDIINDKYYISNLLQGHLFLNTIYPFVFKNNTLMYSFVLLFFSSSSTSTSLIKTENK